MPLFRKRQLESRHYEPALIVLIGSFTPVHEVSEAMVDLVMEAASLIPGVNRRY